MSVYLIFYLLFIQISLLLPGFVLVKKTGLLSKNPGIELSFSYLVSIVFFAALALADYVLKFSPVLSRVICWAVIVYCAVELVRLGYYKNLVKLRFPLICLLLMSIFSSAFIGLSFNARYHYVPDPTPQAGNNYHVLNVKVLNVAQTQANDNYIPYRQAQFIVNRSDPGKDSFIREWGVGFFQRTPLMGAVTANYFTLLNDKPPIAFTWSPVGADPDHTYVKFQIIAGVMNALFIVPAFFLLSKFFNRKTAVVACLFMVTSQFFLYNAVFSWPKSLVAFFILLSWLLLLEERLRFTVLAGITSGVAYLAHDLSVLYIGASVLLLLANKRLRETLVFGLATIVFAIPWLFTANIIYRAPSSFIYYPISTGGIPQLDQKKLIIHQFFHTSPLRLLYIRLENLFYLLSPYQLLTSEGGQALSTRMWALGLYSIPGSIGFGLIIPAFAAALKRLGGRDFWILALSPVILSCLIIGWPKGLGALHFAEGVAVLLSGLGVFYLLQLKNLRWLFLGFAVSTLQLIFFIDYSYRYAVGSWFTHPADLLRLIAMAGIVILCGWSVYKTANGKKIWLAG